MYIPSSWGHGNISQDGSRSRHCCPRPAARCWRARRCRPSISGNAENTIFRNITFISVTGVDWVPYCCQLVPCGRGSTQNPRSLRWRRGSRPLTPCPAWTWISFCWPPAMDRQAQLWFCLYVPPPKSESCRNELKIEQAWLMDNWTRQRVWWVCIKNADIDNRSCAMGRTPSNGWNSRRRPRWEGRGRRTWARSGAIPLTIMTGSRCRYRRFGSSPRPSRRRQELLCRTRLAPVKSLLKMPCSLTINYSRTTSFICASNF